MVRRPREAAPVRGRRPVVVVVVSLALLAALLGLAAATQLARTVGTALAPTGFDGDLQFVLGVIMIITGLTMLEVVRRRYYRRPRRRS